MSIGVGGLGVDDGTASRQRQHSCEVPGVLHHSIAYVILLCRSFLGLHHAPSRPMKFVSGQIQLSATDLAHFLSCRHLTALDMAVAHGVLARPATRTDPLLDILIKRGAEHEARYVERLGHTLEVRDLNDLPHADRDLAVARTLEAMRDGADVIVQGALMDGCWYGRPDVLEKVNTPSALGGWSYEVTDTKLVRETRGGTILQLSLYSELLAHAQGTRPERFHVVTPDAQNPRQTFRVDDFGAYFRFVRNRMVETIVRNHEEVADENYPDPVDYCQYCRWSSRCDARRHADDHLSLVAGITRLQRRELEGMEVRTLTELATLPLPLPFKPRRGSVESYERSREQARLQLESRSLPFPRYDTRPVEAGFGLTRLPEPSPGDVFLDLEGDPFAVEGGREYLFGVVTVGADGTVAYEAFWGCSERDERLAFEQVIDLITARAASDPRMHVYHYAPYEPAALKRLMGRHACRADELDALLRAERFVDLYGVVKQGLFVGVESYSLKRLEPLYAFQRDVELLGANRALRAMEAALELDAVSELPEAVRETIAGYNRDDCVSTLRLRDWLERVRKDVEAGGTAVPRPVARSDGDASVAVTERAQRVADLRLRLLAGVPELRAERDGDQQARWLLAYLLDFHRREEKVTWWEYFRLRDLTDEELFDEPQAVSGLTFVKRVGIKTKKGRPTGTVIDRYSFPPQEMEIGVGEGVHQRDQKLGKVTAVDRAARTIDIEKGPKLAETHPTAVFAHMHYSAGVIEDSLFSFGEDVAAAGSPLAANGGTQRAFQDLLRRAPPRLSTGTFDGTSASVELAVRTVGDLSNGVLPIQGPPGAGKTYTGAHMICELISKGKRVGVTANSHKVILNLLDAVRDASHKLHVDARVAHRCDDEDRIDNPDVIHSPSWQHALEMLESGEVNVLGGTAWLWARPELELAVDVLFVDEAGQVALANVVAVSRAAQSVVLLGDPQQLEQPIKGTHPDGVGVSALQHLLAGHPTVPADMGMLLPVTWRLSPSICEFTSELYYERKLRSRDGLEKQVLTGTGSFDGSGLWLVEVPHEDNRNYSDEEVDVVEGLVRQLIAKRSRWTDMNGKTQQMRGADIVVVAPFNAQVNRLADRLEGLGVLVGTVDKIQGREAAVAIYSMATSTPEDAPRGMEFLYSPNRLNVATSRARCAAILVASPALFAPECQTPKQMRMANGVCRYREVVNSDT